jgi:hypothetical protein
LLPLLSTADLDHAALASAFGVKRRLRLGGADLSGSGQQSPTLSKRLNVSRTVDAARPRRRRISRVGTPVENFGRLISRTWRIETLSAVIDHVHELPQERS